MEAHNASKRMLYCKQPRKKAAMGRLWPAAEGTQVGNSGYAGRELRLRRSGTPATQVGDLRHYFAFLQASVRVVLSS